MPGQANELVQTIATLVGLKQQQQQIAEQHRQNQIASLQQFLQLGRQTTTADQPGLVKAFADMGVAPPETLQHLLDTTVATADVRAGKLEHQQLDTLSAPEKAEVFRAGAYHQWAGMSEGGLRADRAVAQMDPRYFTQRALIEGGQALSAGQVQQGDQFQQAQQQQASQFGQSLGLQRQEFDQSVNQFRQNIALQRDQFNENKQQFGDTQTLGWASLAQQGALSEANIQADLKAKMDALQAKGVDAKSILTGRDAALKELQNIATSGKSVSPAIIQGQVNAYNAYEMQARRLGLSANGPNAPLMTYGDAINPSFWQKLMGGGQ